MDNFLWWLKSKYRYLDISISRYLDTSPNLKIALRGDFFMLYSRCLYIILPDGRKYNALGAEVK